MKTSHRSLSGSSARTSHFRIAQKTTAVQREERAYTSDSTAENQNESEKAYAIAPITPAAMICQRTAPAGSVPDSPNVLRTRAVIVQHRNSTVSPLARADPKFIQYAIRAASPNARLEITFCNMRNKGAPG